MGIYDGYGLKSVSRLLLAQALERLVSTWLLLGVDAERTRPSARTDRRRGEEDKFTAACLAATSGYRVSRSYGCDERAVWGCRASYQRPIRPVFSKALTDAGH